MPYNLRPKSLEKEFKSCLKMEDISDHEEDTDDDTEDYEYEGDDESSESDSDLETELEIDQEEIRLIKKDQHLLIDKPITIETQRYNNEEEEDDNNDMEV